MERTRIGRNVKTTKCKGTYYDKNNNKWPFDVTVYGQYDIDQLTRKVGRLLKTNRLLIDPESIEYDSFWASMPVDKFVEMADIVEHEIEEG